MSCHYQSLYTGKDGYVVRCKECGHYQVAYLCVMLTIEKEEFRSFRRKMEQHYKESLSLATDYHKCVIVETAAAGTRFLFSRAEIKRLTEILDEADTEEQAQNMLLLFQQELE
jgi:hypothetical protein